MSIVSYRLLEVVEPGRILNITSLILDWPGKVIGKGDLDSHHVTVYSLVRVYLLNSFYVVIIYLWRLVSYSVGKLVIHRIL